MLSTFLTNLFEDGRVVVPESPEFLPEDMARSRAWLSEQEPGYRLHLPPGLPEFVPDAALAASRALYRGCQFVVYRDFCEEELEDGLRLDLDESAAAVHYSVDVVLRFLPDLARLARAAAPDDPLVGRLRALGAKWPLSSVGMPGLSGIAFDVLRSHAGLWCFYLERVVAKADDDRLADPEVKVAVEQQAGLYPELVRTSAFRAKS